MSGSVSSTEFWKSIRNGSIEIPLCKDCNRFVYYVRPFCPLCYSENLETIHVGLIGTLIAYVLYPESVGSFDLNDKQAGIGVIELDNEIRLLGPLFGPFAAIPRGCAIGSSVEVEPQAKDKDIPFKFHLLGVS